MPKYPSKVGEGISLLDLFRATALVIGVVAVMSLAVILDACATQAPSVTGSPGADEVWIVNGSFTPAKIRVDLNTSETTVTWTNKDRKTYIVTSDTGLFSYTLPPGASFNYTFTEHRNFWYRNNLNMTGLVFVAQRTSEVCLTCHDMVPASH
jgi:plastocyanin